MKERQNGHGPITQRTNRGEAPTSSTLRRRSPLVYWTAVLLAAAMGVGVIGSLVSLVP